MKRLGYTITKNALANVVRGGASAIAALVIPHFLTRALDHDDFAAWALMLQIAAYANFLDFGLQLAVARYLAQAMEIGDDSYRDRLVGTAFGLLAVAGLLAFAIFGVIVWQLPHIFHAVPMQPLSELRAGLIIMVLFAATSLPLSTFTGVLLGLHRNEYPALAIGGSRILGAIAVLVSVHYTHSLVWLALCLGGFNLLGSLAQYLIARTLLPLMRVHLSVFNRKMARELIGYCSTLSIWSFAMLLVGGLDVTIVGYFNFSAVGYYSIAATLIGFLTGLNNSISGAMMTPVAVLQARKEYDRIKYLITTATRLTTYANMGLTMFAFLCGRLLLQLWIGEAYAAQTLPILEILLVAQTIRLMGNAYGTALVATGQQRYGIFPALVEGSINLLLSVIGMVLIGAAGVAWATLIAATIGVSLQVLLVMRRVKEIALARKLFVKEGVVKPLLAFIPLVLWVFCRNWYMIHFQPSDFGIQVPFIACLLITFGLVISGLHQLRKTSN